jgi:anti-sigma regulatory factor (Ser/Thr protein kinase)
MRRTKAPSVFLCAGIPMTAHRAAAQTGTEDMESRLTSLLASAVPPQGLMQRRPATSPQRAAARALAAQPDSVKIARDLTRGTLHNWGMPALIDDAVLVVSELVTNALRYGAAGRGDELAIWLQLLAQPPYLMCLVTDTSRDIPLRRQTGAGDASGRGLQVIESCCSRWGWHLLDQGGKVVWALLPRD